MLLFMSNSIGASNFVGIYDLDVKINNNSFVDILYISTINVSGEVSGKFEVNNVFKSDFSGKLVKSHLSGSFMAKERGEEFLVELVGEFDSYCSVKGVLKQNDSTFARFTGKKRGDDECRY